MSALGWNTWRDTSSASTPQHAHACNCIGCCPKCGTCRTWYGHTADYCALLQRQALERASAIRASHSFQERLASS